MRASCYGGRPGKKNAYIVCGCRCRSLSHGKSMVGMLIVLSRLMSDNLYLTEHAIDFSKTKIATRYWNYVSRTFGLHTAGIAWSPVLSTLGEHRWQHRRYLHLSNIQTHWDWAVGDFLAVQTRTIAWVQRMYTSSFIGGPARSAFDLKLEVFFSAWEKLAASTFKMPCNAWLTPLLFKIPRHGNGPFFDLARSWDMA